MSDNSSAAKVKHTLATGTGKGIGTRTGTEAEAETETETETRAGAGAISDSINNSTCISSFHNTGGNVKHKT